jgi:cytoskeletal protein CcmA (bactofilin family)
LLGFDTNGDLSISGSGYFKGEIHATNGSFTGTVNATDGSFAGKIEAGEGSIGGFTIDDNSLSAINDSIVLYSGNGEEEGSIYAKNLTLGEGAKI